MNETLHIYKDFVSLNFDKRPKKIDTIVIHSTHMIFTDSIQRLCDEDAKVSCHYIINLDGKVYQLIEEQKRAWHTGISYWRGKQRLNDNSIGIELVDTNKKNLRIKKFPKSQMESLIILLKLLLRKYKIQKHNIVAHSDVAPDRKDDPGEYFDWSLLASHDIVHYHNINLKKETDSSLITSKSPQTETKKIQRMLKAYGYRIKITGEFDEQTKEVILAFRRRFNPCSLKKKYFNIVDFKILSDLQNTQNC